MSSIDSYLSYEKTLKQAIFAARATIGYWAKMKNIYSIDKIWKNRLLEVTANITVECINFKLKQKIDYERLEVAPCLANSGTHSTTCPLKNT